MTITDRRIWALAGLAGACALGLAFITMTEPAPPPAPAPVQPLPLALPTAPAEPRAMPPAADAATPAPAATTQAPPPATPTIGSEGYGPHIERALAGTSPDEAWEAVQWLQSCASAEQRRTSVEVTRGLGVEPALMTQLMQATDAEIRRCQTVTAQHRAMRAELAARAMHAGIHDAAAAYADAVSPAALTPTERREVTDAMRRDAEAGFPGSLLDMADSAAGWGISDEDRLRYLFAFAELQPLLGGRAVVEARLKQGTIPFQTAPTPAQLAAGQRAGGELAARIRARQPS